MKQVLLLTLFAFGCVGCLTPQPQIQTPQPEPALAASATPLPAVTLTARDVKAAPDIEEALRWATSDGMRLSAFQPSNNQAALSHGENSRSTALP